MVIPVSCCSAFTLDDRSSVETYLVRCLSCLSQPCSALAVEDKSSLTATYLHSTYFTICWKYVQAHNQFLHLRPHFHFSGYHKRLSSFLVIADWADMCSSENNFDCLHSWLLFEAYTFSGNWPRLGLLFCTHMPQGLKCLNNVSDKYCIIGP